MRADDDGRWVGCSSARLWKILCDTLLETGCSGRMWEFVCAIVALSCLRLVRSFLRDCRPLRLRRSQKTEGPGAICFEGSELALATPGQNVAAFLRTAALQEDSCRYGTLCSE